MYLSLEGYLSGEILKTKIIVYHYTNEEEDGDKFELAYVIHA